MATMRDRLTAITALACVVLAACSAPDVPSQSPGTPRVEPSATAVEGSPTAGRSRLRAGDWVEFVADSVELRDAPSETGAVIGVVPAGGTALVIGDTVEADGAIWVPVAGPGLPFDNGCVSGRPGVFGLDCPLWRGWLPESAADGEPVLARTTIECPAEEPTTANELIAIPLGVSVSCFGGETLSVRAHLADEMAGRGCPPDHDEVMPPWMHPCAEFFFPSRTGNGLQGVVALMHPSVASCESWSDETCPVAPLIGESVQLRGMFDHPESTLCDERTPHVEFGVPDKAFLEYFCRTRFVITGLDLEG